MTGIVFDIKRFAVHDGPGIRTTVFLKGCPLRCAWCHNPEGLHCTRNVWRVESRCIGCGRCETACTHGAIERIDGGIQFSPEQCVSCGACTAICPTRALEFDSQVFSVDEVMHVIRADSKFYVNSNGGVTISGGEPTYQQAAFALELLRQCKREGFHTALESSLFTSAETLEKFIPLVDLFIADIKLMDCARHLAASGVENTRIHENIRHLAASGAQLLIRTPLIPGSTDDDDNLNAIAAFIAALPNQENVHVELLNFNPLFSQKYSHYGAQPNCGANAALSRTEMQRKNERMRQYGLYMI